MVLCFAELLTKCEVELDDYLVSDFHDVASSRWVIDDFPGHLWVISELHRTMPGHLFVRNSLFCSLSLISCPGSVDLSRPDEEIGSFAKS